MLFIVHSITFYGHTGHIYGLMPTFVLGFFSRKASKTHIKSVLKGVLGTSEIVKGRVDHVRVLGS